MKKLLTFLTFILAAAVVFGQSNGGRTALPFLRMDMGARYYGMAGAATAFADDVTGAAFYNPAALGQVQSLQLAATTFEDKLDMKAQQAAIAVPVPFLSLFGNNPLNVSFNAYLYDKGEIEEFSRNRNIGKDIALSLSIGEHISGGNFDLTGNTVSLDHYIGITGKYLRSSLPLPSSGKADAESFAFDAGYQIVADGHFGLGFAAKNIGQGIKYINVKDPLPTTLSAGVFFTPVDMEVVSWTLTTDYLYYIKDKDSRLRVGTEAVFMDLLSVRGGVKLLEELDSEYTIGFGLKLFGFEVDFGAILNPQLNDDKTYQASIAYKFPIKNAHKQTYREEKRTNYKEYKDKKVKESQARADKNASPILYQ